MRGRPGPKRLALRPEGAGKPVEDGIIRLMDAETRRPRAEWLDQLVARSEEPIGVQLSPEQEIDFPVEIFAEHGPGFVASGTLGISQGLEDDLIQWLRWWQRRVSPLGDE